MLLRLEARASRAGLALSCLLACPSIGCGASEPEVSPRLLPDAEEPVDLDRGRDLLAAHLRPGESLREVMPWTFPNAGRSIVVGVAVSADGARRFEVDNHGQAISLEALAAVEAAARSERFGKMTEALYDRQRDLPDSDPLDFIVYVAASPTTPSLPYLAPDQAIPVAELTAHIRSHRASWRQSSGRPKARS